MESIDNNVIRLWLSHLLHNVDDLPEGQIWRLELPRVDLRKHDWMETFDAFTVYRLARNSLNLIVGKDEKGRFGLETWERSEGGSARLGRRGSELHWKLLDLIMPRVTRLQVGQEAKFYLLPPCVHWQEVLKQSKDYITSPKEWGIYVEYIGPIEHLFYYEYPGSYQCNARYQDKLIGFSENEVSRLIEMMDLLIHARRYNIQATLGPYTVSLLNRALDMIGDLEIGSVSGRWRLDSFLRRSEGE